MICIVETWLSSDISDNELVIQGYQIFRHDRDRHGGGVMMYVLSSFAADLCNSVGDIELLQVSICSLKYTHKYCIALFYRPPSASVNCFDCLSRNLLNLNPSSFNYFVLLGDFNINYFCTTSFCYAHLMYCLSPFNLTQVVRHSTRVSHSSSTLIDLIFVTSTSFLYTCSALPPLGTSDHSGLQLKLKVVCSKRNKENQRIMWNYTQGDFVKARHMIESFDWDSLFFDDIHTTLHQWQRKFLLIMEQCIPRLSHSTGRLPWLTKRLKRLIKRKNTLFRAWKREGNPTVHNKYKSVRNKVTKLLRATKENFFRNLNTADQKVFWKTVNQLTKRSSSVPVLVQGREKAFTGQEKANLLSEVFRKSFNFSIAPLSFADLDQVPVEPNSCPDEFLCTDEEIQHQLETLDVSKSSGPDGISAQMLKPVAQSIAPSIARLINQSIKSSTFPVFLENVKYRSHPKARR